MKIIGQVLLWAGFLSGSLATVINAPQKGVEHILEMTAEEAAAQEVELPDLSSVTVPEEGWNLIPWTWYLLSAGVCVVGIMLLRSSKSSDGIKSDKSEASLGMIRVSLDRLIEGVEDLVRDTAGWKLDNDFSGRKIPPSQIAAQIDDLHDDFRVFADGRDSLTAEYGLDVFADVMTQFSAGERAINRAWSATADGYVDEAITCIERGLMLLRETQVLLSAAAESH